MKHLYEMFLKDLFFKYIANKICIRRSEMKIVREEFYLCHNSVLFHEI